MGDKLSNLDRNSNVEKSSINELEKFEHSKILMSDICESLTFKIDKYEPVNTIKNIKFYIESPRGLGIILYSEISNYIYDLIDDKRGDF